MGGREGGKKGERGKWRERGRKREKREGREGEEGLPMSVCVYEEVCIWNVCKWVAVTFSEMGVCADYLPKVHLNLGHKHQYTPTL